MSVYVYVELDFLLAESIDYFMIWCCGTWNEREVTSASASYRCAKLQLQLENFAFTWCFPGLLIV